MFNFVYYQVRDVMSTQVVTVHPQATLKEAEAIFQKHDFNGLPVVDNEGKVVGLVTKLDLLKAFVFTKASKVPPYAMIMNREVSGIMTENPHWVDQETPLTRVLAQMIETRYKSFPVLEDQKLLGIVAREDVLKALHLAAEGIAPTRLGEMVP